MQRASLVALLAALVVLTAGFSVQGAPRWRTYQDMVRRWHQPVLDRQAPVDEHGRPMLVLVSLNSGESIAVPAQSEEGGFNAISLAKVEHLLRDLRSGLSHPVEPALLDRVYLAQRHFQAQEVRVVSGYRAPGVRGSGNHSRGRAMDLVLPGVSDKDFVNWARQLGFSGVGIYPSAGYCHLDVRRESYFWMDRSGPGQRNREFPVFKDLARKVDAEAKRRGRNPELPYLLPSSRIQVIWGGVHQESGEHEGGEDQDE